MTVCGPQVQLSPVDEDDDGENHREDEEEHDGNHLMDGDGLCRGEKMFKNLCIHILTQQT